MDVLTMIYDKIIVDHQKEINKIIRFKITFYFLSASDWLTLE